MAKKYLSHFLSLQCTFIVDVFQVHLLGHCPIGDHLHQVSNSMGHYYLIGFT